ncbi:signal peptidase I [Paenibacillus sp. J31TS4]|uniref:signal peptidase I n=1 Tax=Paenibacillus sp. J31TS4 TaxID=2807195 RepID=UPI001B251113|nr:signal peptidase I [Paenibacillus sp. J31TS4]GIP36788.1 signal peptidase I [Paenibacillus sp. J31TS4]
MEQDNLEPKEASVKNEVWEWVKALVIAAVLVFLIRWFVFAPFIVDGPSMEPNFYTGERLIVSKIVYTFREPKRGEVVVFHAPAGRDYIKRVIGLPGETVKIANNKIYINNEELKEPYLVEAVNNALTNGEMYNRDFPETKVPEGSVFVLGDNRLNSQDSRAASVGSVPFNKIVGRADVIFWPLDKFSFVNHN